MSHTIGSPKGGVRPEQQRLPRPTGIGIPNARRKGPHHHWRRNHPIGAVELLASRVRSSTHHVPGNEVGTPPLRLLRVREADQQLLLVPLVSLVDVGAHPSTGITVIVIAVPPRCRHGCRGVRRIRRIAQLRGVEALTIAVVQASELKAGGGNDPKGRSIRIGSCLTTEIKPGFNLIVVGQVVRHKHIAAVPIVVRSKVRRRHIPLCSDDPRISMHRLKGPHHVRPKENWDGHGCAPRVFNFATTVVVVIRNQSEWRGSLIDPLVNSGFGKRVNNVPSPWHPLPFNAGETGR